MRRFTPSWLIAQKDPNFYAVVAGCTTPAAALNRACASLGHCIRSSIRSVCCASMRFVTGFHRPCSRYGEGSHSCSTQNLHWYGLTTSTRRNISLISTTIEHPQISAPVTPGNHPWRGQTLTYCVMEAPRNAISTRPVSSGDGQKGTLHTCSLSAYAQRFTVRCGPRRMRPHNGRSYQHQPALSL
jgi:hypothetical protein